MRSERMVTPDERDIAHHRPRFQEATVASVVSENYGLRGRWKALPSDKDQNFQLTSSDGTKYVVKIAHALENRSFLEAQHAVLDHLAAKGIEAPRAIEARDGERIISVPAEDKRPHWLRILTFLEGVPLAKVRPHSVALLESLGSYLGRFDAALTDVDHPATRRDYIWDLARAHRTFEEFASDLTSDDEHRFVDYFEGLFESIVAPRLSTLRSGLVHNDANDYNILVNGPANRSRRVVGLIDFGDLIHTILAAEPAVAAAYVSMGKRDPLQTAAEIVGAYHREYPLAEAEIAVLYPLIGLRLCVSICISAFQMRLEPENTYLTVSREPAISLLSRWTQIHPRFAEYVFRQACGFEPCPRSTPLRDWLRSHASDAVTVVDLPEAQTIEFDFSVGSSEWSFRELIEPGLATEEIERRIVDAGSAVGIGRYNEVRLAYQEKQFETPTEQRTVHLGIDVFAAPGTSVRAPLEGVVHSLADNDRPYDYGPTVIVEHEPPDGPKFYTLYGHLSKASLAVLQPGRTVSRGEAVGEIGGLDENGGWAPHLHFQVIADLLDHDGDFPGVAAPSVRDVWLSICPNPSVLVGIDAHAPRTPGTEEVLTARSRRVGPSLSISYQRPIHVRRGYMQFLYDRDGRRYLDSVNNVAHVGHSHPRVVEAVSRTMRVLNTNTRYVYEELAEYARRLLGTLPEPLEICYLVNSGSEANDLALRLARTHTGGRETIVIDHAYHGNLSSLIEISPYKFNGPGGSGRPKHTHVVPMPDPLRIHDITDAAKGAAAIIRDVENPAAFIAESVLSCGGQVFFPDGYLRELYAAAKRGGAVTIADEVQTGLGRVGSAFWAFELQDVVPDIVTIGKPIGNGHPLGAVVTTRGVAESFDTGMEYFNTFGGNPVACSAGLAVLDVLRDESLQDHARSTGAYFVRRLEELQRRHPVIGDVRGSGLFIGVELVRNREDATAATEETAYVVERMREKGILTSRDGPYRNVIKIKPPLAFDASDVDTYVGALDDVLEDDFVKARLS